MTDDEFRMFAPTGELSLTESTELPGTVDDLWPRIGHFCSQDWHPDVLRSEIFEGLDGQTGALRELATRDGRPCIEELLWQNDDLHTQVYRALESPLPVRNYVAELELVSEGDHCRFTWRSRFDAGEDATCREALDAVARIYQSGIDALHERFDPAHH